eukprot:5418291-Prymnesium_polylepis.1
MSSLTRGTRCDSQSHGRWAVARPRGGGVVGAMRRGRAARWSECHGYTQASSEQLARSHF